MKKLIYVLALVLACTACGQGGKEKTDTTASMTTFKQEPAAQNPDAKLPVADGMPGVVDFTATWCPPCQQFKPIFEKAKQKYAGKIDFVSVDVDANAELANAYKVQGIPMVLFVDAKGNIVDTEVGQMTEEAFNAKLEGLLK